MFNKVTFKVGLSFSDPVKGEEIQEIATNLVEAISDSIERGLGIAPKASEGYTKSIYVSCFVPAYPGINALWEAPSIFGPGAGDSEPAVVE